MTDNQKSILKKLASKLEVELDREGLSEGLLFEFGCEMALRFHKKMKAEPKKPIEERRRDFIRDVYEAGRFTYTKKMLDNFIEKWTEPTHSMVKMKFECEKTWNVKGRLKTWATNNYDKIECYLSESEKTVKQRQEEFKESLKPYVGKYTSDILNSFYKYWTQPENVPNPTRIRHQLEQFWDLGIRLSQWNDRNTKIGGTPLKLNGSSLDNLDRFNKVPQN